VDRLEAPGARAQLICGTRRGGGIGGARITTNIDARERTPSMTKRAIAGAAVGLALVLGLAGCTNPYDPAQRAVGGGLLGAGTGAAIGAAAGGGHGAALGAAIGGAAGMLGGIATTPPPPYYPPQAYYPPPPGYYAGYGAPPPASYPPPSYPPPPGSPVPLPN
jgi:hypothetical protein